MKMNETTERYYKLRNSLIALVFWNIIIIDIALIWRAFSGQ